MRPKKEEEQRKGIVVQVRVTEAEGEQFRLQAMARKMAMSSYLRYLLLEDADRLSMEGKLQENQEGQWEIFVMGKWQRPETK